MAASAHSATVVLRGGRYPFLPTCSCGWVTRGYVAEHAAQLMADDHEEAASA
jgi:hypothetical protein